MPSYTPDDTLLGPLKQALADTVRAQIPSIANIYPNPPDQAPNNNSVCFTNIEIKPDASTYGKLRFTIKLSLAHLFTRPSGLSAAWIEAQTYFLPWMQVLNAWANQDLEDLDLSFVINTPKVSLQQVLYAGTPYVGLVIPAEFLAEINIPVS